MKNYLKKQKPQILTVAIVAMYFFNQFNYKPLNLYIMKSQTFKTTLFFTILFVAIVTIHLLTPQNYK